MMHKTDANYVFYELTRSICPDCRSVIDAQVILRDNKVYMRKRCRIAVDERFERPACDGTRCDARSADGSTEAIRSDTSACEAALSLGKHRTDVSTIADDRGAFRNDTNRLGVFAHAAGARDRP